MTTFQSEIIHRAARERGYIRPGYQTFVLNPDVIEDHTGRCIGIEGKIREVKLTEHTDYEYTGYPRGDVLFRLHMGVIGGPRIEFLTTSQLGETWELVRD